MCKRVGWILIGLILAWTESSRGQLALRVEGASYFHAESTVPIQAGCDNGIVIWAKAGHVGSGVPSHAAVVGESVNGPGVFGLGEDGPGLEGKGNHGPGVEANSIHKDGVAAFAFADDKSGVFSVNDNASGYAGYFRGRVHVTGQLSNGGGSFKIDHPLDPENRYLYHSFVESPEMMNVYNGNVVLDHHGEAWVELPEWFEALNRDFRYQLTPIGGFAPVYISQEIVGNRLRIAGGTPGLKVSWQVTGIRQDPWAETHRIAVEEDKPDSERGTYLHPVEWQQPTDRDVQWVHRPELMGRNEARWDERR